MSKKKRHRKQRRGGIGRYVFTTVGIIAVVVAITAFVFVKAAYVVPVLMYHSIDYNDKATKLSVSPDSFARQMEFLHKNHYNVVSLEKAAAGIRRGEKTPPKTVVITFDDGFYNNYRYAYPVLKKYKFPATIFVITDEIGKAGWMDWKELEEMSDSGIISIGSHTKSHLWLPSLDAKKLEDELAGSKKVLEERLGRKADEFCYPMGAFDRKVQDALRKTGYSCAVATNPGRFYPVDDIYAIKRVRISRTSDNLFIFWIETSGFYTWIKEHRDE
ncbi:MAG: polysaccharide deacetylase family protein [Candidatus Omnitrophota bacterium]|nr:polysaccharide deacetylase family protein [Candidatus Omnitrophota bacterium]